MTDRDDAEGVIRYLNAQMLATFHLPPPAVGPEPLMCPICGTTRYACLLRFGRDPEHERQILARLDEAASKVTGH